MNVGIIGAGGIAKKMAFTLNGMEDATCYGIASRSIEKVQEFAQEFNIEHAYGSYEEMMQDDAIDLVYVAVPHSHHKDCAMLAISYGKPVLCEKAFMANAKQAKEVLDYAKEKNVFITEAIWTRYMPSRQIIDDVIASGIIGDVATVTANLSYNIQHVERLFKPELAGGALLDVGVYAINFAFMVLGSDYKDVASNCVKNDLGVDLQSGMIFTYDNGTMAVLYSSAYGPSEQYGIVVGSKGYLIAKNINNIDVIEVYNEDRELLESHTVPEQITGFEDQVRASMRAIKAGEIECSEMPHAETMKVMETMDGLRADWGIKYPFE